MLKEVHPFCLISSIEFVTKSFIYISPNTYNIESFQFFLEYDIA